MKTSLKFKKILKKEKALILPGVYNAFVAKLVERAGFEALYVTGAGISNTLLGLADVGITSSCELLNQVKYITDAVNIPVIVDIDTGFGTARNIVKIINEIESMGVAGVQIEDQIFPKKCGHFNDKNIISREKMIKKIKVISDYSRDKDLNIIARTDSLEKYGIDEAISRSKDYISAGADIIFVEAPKTIEHIKKYAEQINSPKVINIVEGGKTPQLDYETLNELGFDIILHANAPLRAGANAIIEILKILKKEGSTLKSLNKLISLEERNDITDLDFFEKLDEKYF